jgi:type IV secretory pathway VirB3-like protein
MTRRSHTLGVTIIIVVVVVVVVVIVIVIIVKLNTVNTDAKYY